LTNSDLQGADLRSADPEGVLLMGADLRDCCMRHARLAAAEFQRPGTPTAPVQGLDLSVAYVEDLLENQQQFFYQ
jgi:uncharacterized protein YjbI with pentapeptide repeats